MQFITYFNCRLKFDYIAFSEYPLYWFEQCIAMVANIYDIIYMYALYALYVGVFNLKWFS